MARQTLSGLRGMSTCFTPSGARASITAFTKAPVAAIVPVSPAPLTPRGLVGDGVTVRAVRLDDYTKARVRG